jgi:protein-disulfide isomerase
MLIFVLLLVACLAVWDRTSSRVLARTEPPRGPLPSGAISIEGAQIRGDKKAKVALIVFSDFECPYCARSAQDVLPELERQYLRTGKLQLVWRHYPLGIHKNAMSAADGAECAGRQGKFWEFHDWAFQHQKELDQANLIGAAGGLALDAGVFEACLKGQASTKVQADVEAATLLSVAGTPTWFIGVVQADGKVKALERLEGARPFAVFREAIDKVIATVDAPTK